MRAILTIILILLAAALVIWAARPLWDEVQSLRAEQAATADVLGRLEELQGLREEIMGIYNSIPRSKLERLDDFLPPKPDSGNIIVMLEKLTRDRGIRLRRVDFTKTEPQGVPPAVSGQAGARIVRKEATNTNTAVFTFVVSASYEAFRSFLAALEKNLRIVDVTDISFAGGSANLFEFTLKAKSYYQK